MSRLSINYVGRDSILCGGIETYVILSGAQRSRRIYAFLELLRRIDTAKILRLASLAQDDKIGGICSIAAI